MSSPRSDEEAGTRLPASPRPLARSRPNGDHSVRPGLTIDQLPGHLAARITIDEAGCWIWQGTLTHNGYAQARVGSRSDGSRTTARVHRFAFQLLVGRIPEGLELDHLCRVRHCVNPAHLEPVTLRENQLRGIGFVAANAAKTHCVNGHEFTPENTYIEPPNGWRKCRSCNVDRKRKRRSA